MLSPQVNLCSWPLPLSPSVLFAPGLNVSGFLMSSCFQENKRACCKSNLWGTCAHTILHVQRFRSAATYSSWLLSSRSLRAGSHRRGTTELAFAAWDNHVHTPTIIHAMWFLFTMVNMTTRLVYFTATFKSCTLYQLWILMSHMKQRILLVCFLQAVKTSQHFLLC